MRMHNINCVVNVIESDGSLTRSTTHLKSEPPDSTTRPTTSLRGPFSSIENVIVWARALYCIKSSTSAMHNTPLGFIVWERCIGLDLNLACTCFHVFDLDILG